MLSLQMNHIGELLVNTSVKNFVRITPLESRFRKRRLPQLDRTLGRLVGVSGRVAKIAGLSGRAPIGAHVQIGSVSAEIVSDDGQYCLAALYADPIGLSTGEAVQLCGNETLYPSLAWCGDVLDHEGKRMDGSRPPQGVEAADLHQSPPPAINRKPIGPRLETGYAALDTFLPLCQGQRIGLFAGSGVGKTTLLAGLARQTIADVTVIALIGERGREVRHFVDTVLGETGMKNTIVFAATSDAAPAVKLRTSNLAMASAEVFRQQGHHVLCLFDSLTRYAQAHREVALSQGEPPALRAFPPSTFQALSSLCERAGPGEMGEGDITTVFTVLVEGSDMEEPVADTVRGILDGHIVMDRKIAERGRYPAIDIGRSVSRSLPDCASAEENALLSDGRSLLRRYDEARLMIQSGLYAPGGDAQLDRAVAQQDKLDRFLASGPSTGLDDPFEALTQALGVTED
jgi:flagellum-specific ATP synthase